MKQRRGSTDLEWINKYQHSDHHTDRLTRKKMEYRNGEFPMGLPPTPSNYHATRRPVHDHEDYVTLARSQRFSSPLNNNNNNNNNSNRYSISPKTNELISTPLTFRQRSNSLSHTIQPVRYSYESIGCNVPFTRRSSFAYQSPIVSCSTPGSRRDSICDRVSHPSFVTSSRSSRATSVPVRYSSPYSTAGNRTSYVAPVIRSEFQITRRSSLAPRLDDGRRISIYNNSNNNINKYNSRNDKYYSYDRYNNNDKYNYNSGYNNHVGSGNSFVSSYYMRPTIISRY